MKKEILNYVILSELGKGGMGTVYLAQNKNMENDKVAIKVINSSMINDFTRQRLKEEAIILQKLSHTNIVAFKNFHIDEDNNVYLIMEYAEGLSLEDYIRKKHGLIVEKDSEEIFAPILDAFAYAHKNGVLHRDIKPSNIIITETEDKDGNKVIIPKVLDFGIAKIFSKTGTVKDDLFVGTPSYMSPEQIKMEDLDERSDVYSLGVLLYHALTGKPPYDTSTMSQHQIEQSVVESPLKRMKEFYPYISDKIQSVVDKATSKDKQSRYKNCTEFKNAYIKALRPMFTLKTKIAAVIAMLIIIGAGLYIWDYNRLKVRYYKDYVEQYGVPQGVGKVSKTKHKHMARVYKFEYKKHKLLSVSHVNSFDKLIDDGESERVDRPVLQEFSYNENGKVSRVKIKDRNGLVLYVKAYNEKLNVMAFQFDDENGTEKFLSGSIVSYTSKANVSESNRNRISRYYIEYDNDGYAQKIQYRSIDGTPACDDNGIYGVKYERDQKHRISKQQYLNRDGNPYSTKWGLSIKQFTYDKDNNLTKVVYLTRDNKPAFDIVDGLQIYVLQYDKYGNQICVYHNDGNGNPMIPKHIDNSVAGTNYTYNDKGLCTKVQFLGLDHKPMFNQKDGYSGILREYDANGYVSKQTCLNDKGEKITAYNGICYIIYKNDKKGNVLEQWTYDKSGKLCTDKKNDYNVAGVKFVYDSLGRQIKGVYYGTDSKPVKSKDGIYGWECTYNNKNQVTSFTNLGKDLTPAENNEKIITAVVEYDGRGNEIKRTFTDASTKKLKLCSYGYAGERNVYDERGNLIETNFFNTEEKLVLSQFFGYAKIKYEYDENNNLISYKYYDANDKLTSVKGIAGRVYKVDRNGNILEDKPIGTNGELAKGYLITFYKYDQYNNITEVYRTDAAGKPSKNTDGVYRYTYKYDTHNNVTEIRYYGTDNKLTLSNNIAILRHKYNNRGLEVETSCYGKNSEPVKNAAGWSKQKTEYNTLGLPIKQSHFDINGKPTDPKDFPPFGYTEYDDRGNVIKNYCKDEKNNYINFKGEPWAIKRNKYNDMDFLTEEAFYNTNDKPTNTSGNYHKVTYKYNNAYKPTEIAYFNPQGKPTDSKQGFHKMTRSYKDNGNLDIETYYSAGGKVLLKVKYDDNGNSTVIGGSYSGGGGNYYQNTQMSWQDQLNYSKRNLPIRIDNGVYLTTIDYSSTVIRMTVKFTNKYVDDFSKDIINSLKNYGVNLIDYLSESLGIPDDMIFIMTFVDKNGKYITSVRE